MAEVAPTPAGVMLPSDTRHVSIAALLAQLVRARPS